MTITCATFDAAVAVLGVLIDARLRPGRHFRIDIPEPFGPPISFTILVDLPADVLRQLRATPDTIIT